MSDAKNKFHWIIKGFQLPKQEETLGTLSDE